MSGKDAKIKELTKKIRELSIVEKLHIDKVQSESSLRVYADTEEMLTEIDGVVIAYQVEAERINKEIAVLQEELKILLK